jgi:hypothetical protein
MKVKDVNKKLEEIARKYCGVASLKHIQQGEEIQTITIYQLEKALKSAFLSGEKAGYKQGFSDAKQACNCILDEVDIFPKEMFSPIKIDKTEVVV